MKNSFNDKECKKMSKKAFIKAHKHAASEEFLESYYDKLKPKSVKGDSE